MVGRNRVVITGIGVLAANGTGKDAFWSSLLAGESGIGPITRFDTSDIPWKIAGEINDFRPEEYINPKLKPKRQSRNTQFAAAATVMALEDAAISKDTLIQAAPVQITLGVSLGGLDLVEQHTRRIVDKGLNKGLPTVSACVHIIASSFISAMLDVPANLSVISNSCTGGVDAVMAGADSIRRGETELAIVGGTDAVIIPSVISGLGYAGMLASDNDNPEKKSRPFDMRRSGGVASEGAGILVLESLDHALERGAHMYAEILGYGVAGNVSTHVTDGLERCMRKAIHNSGCMPGDIDYISAHGSSDLELDVAETIAIKNVLGEHAYTIPVTSIKGATGNPLAAGAALQCIATSLTMRKGIIPHTTNYEVPDPDCDLDYVPSTPRQMDVSISMINSHGTGGVNSSLLMGKI